MATLTQAPESCVHKEAPAVKWVMKDYSNMLDKRIKISKKKKLIREIINKEQNRTP